MSAAGASPEREVSPDPPEGRRSDSRLSEQVATVQKRVLRAHTVEKTPRFWINPDGSVRGFCDSFIGILILYSVVSVPLRIAFELEATPGTGGYFFEKTIDVFFAFDIISNFRTGVQVDDPTGLTSGVSYEPWRVAKRYFRFWFWVDLVSTLDIADIVRLIVGDGGGDEDGVAGEQSSLLKSTKLLRIIRLFRLLKLVRLFKLNKLVRRLEEAGLLPPTALCAALRRAPLAPRPRPQSRLSPPHASHASHPSHPSTTPRARLVAAATRRSSR